MAVISMLTDFGARDAYVGLMKGVILGIDPGICLVDLTHEIEPGDIIGAGYLLASAWHWFPPETVHLAVVDPGVGSERRAMVARADHHWFVGPDNGLFTAALDSASEVSIRELSDDAWRLLPVSRTFHGRDIFAPAAAWLCRGISWERMGPPLAEPVRVELVPGQQADAGGVIRGVVVHVDVFGNLITSISREQFEGMAEGEGRLTLCWDGGQSARLVGTYAEAPPGIPVMLMGSSGCLEVAVNKGSAAGLTGVRRGDDVRLERPGREGQSSTGHR